MGILGGVLSSVAGGLVGGLFGGDNEQTTRTVPSGATTPQWSSYQLPYMWTGPAWNPYASLPQFTAAGLNYGQALSGGFNPATGAAAPMGFGQLLSGLGAPNMGGDAGGILSLLGYGANTPPALLTNNPMYSGMNVVDPQNLAGGVLGRPVSQAGGILGDRPPPAQAASGFAASGPQSIWAMLDPRDSFFRNVPPGYTFDDFQARVERMNKARFEDD